MNSSLSSSFSLSTFAARSRGVSGFPLLLLVWYASTTGWESVTRLLLLDRRHSIVVTRLFLIQRDMPCFLRPPVAWMQLEGVLDDVGTNTMYGNLGLPVLVLPGQNSREYYRRPSTCLSQPRWTGHGHEWLRVVRPSSPLDTTLPLSTDCESSHWCAAANKSHASL